MGVGNRAVDVSGGNGVGGRGGDGCDCRARVRRVESVRRGRERLEGIERCETVRAVAWPHSNLQPVRGACKNARAEIECDSEQSVAHAGRRIRDWPCEGRAVGGRIVNRKS